MIRTAGVVALAAPPGGARAVADALEVGGTLRSGLVSSALAQSSPCSFAV